MNALRLPTLDELGTLPYLRAMVEPAIQRPHTSKIVSSTIESLMRDVQTDPLGAEERFWKQIQAAGAPIQESTRDPSTVLVTFLFRGDSTTQHVVVLGGATGQRIED